MATALGYAACQHGHSVLFANAIDVINTLSAAQAKGLLKTQLKRYLSTAILVLDGSVTPLPLKNLIASKRNVRKTGGDSIDDIAASILRPGFDPEPYGYCRNPPQN